jgi:two-component system, NtrC family, response regulator AtoC
LRESEAEKREITAALAMRNLARELRRVTFGDFMKETASGNLPPLEAIFGNTPGMRVKQERIDALAQTSVPVLILGESGTGKDIIARLLHGHSANPNAAFVKVNCPAIPAALLEAELFGYEKGGFTGAYATKRGWIEAAHHGTLFLDEIGDLNLSLQAKLLQVLQDGTFNRIGGREDRKVEVRIISATNRDLQDLVRSGAFRGDLMYRINAMTIHLPALRDRIADLPLLVDYFMTVYQKKFGRSVPALSDDTIHLLQHYHWPGNIRELENLIRRYVILGTEESITSELFPAAPESAIPAIEIDPELSLKQMTKQVMQSMEREIILKVLKANNWNRKKTAVSLRISYRSLIYKMREAGFPLLRGESAEQVTAGEAKRMMAEVTEIRA